MCADLKADTPRVPARAKRGRSRKLWKKPKRGNKKMQAPAGVYSDIWGGEVELEVISEMSEPTPLWSNAKCRDFVKVQWGHHFEGQRISEEFPKDDKENSSLVANCKKSNRTVEIEDNKIRPSSNNLTNMNDVNHNKPEKPKILSNIPKSFERQVGKFKERNTTPNKLSKRLAPAIIAENQFPLQDCLSEIEDKISKRARIKSTDGSKSYLRSTQAFLAKTRANSDKIPHGVIASNSENFLSTKNPNTMNSRCDDELLSTNEHTKISNSHQELNAAVFRSRKVPDFSQVWRPKQVPKKMTRPKPFMLHTERRAKSVKNLVPMLSMSSSYYGKKSTKQPTIPREFRLRTEERSKLRKLD